MDNTITSVNTNDFDKISRGEIVKNTAMNYIVEAGAGSGKTTMLVRRMVAMVEAGIDIRKIAAITFTKAAANEFYERFQKLLFERSNINKPYSFEANDYGALKPQTEESCKNCLEALQNIDLCFMGTIDSFCQLIVSEHPYEAGVPADAILLSEDDARILYKNFYVDIVNGKHGAELQKLAESFKIYHRNPEAAFVDVIQFFMNRRNVDFDVPKYTHKSLESTFNNDKAALLNCLDFIKKQKDAGVDIFYPSGTAETLEFANNFDSYLRALKRDWDLSFSSVFYALGQISKNLRITRDEYEENAAQYNKFFYANLKYPKTKSAKSTIDEDNGILAKINEQRYDATISFALKCVPVIAKELLKKGYLTFFDYLYYLRNMLKKDAENSGELIKHIRTKHAYFLIDEFQDTNPIQSQIFFYLSSENPVKDWKKCIPAPGSLFIVGDPKQSIYRFNNADIVAFETVKSLFSGSGAAQLELIRNYRSARALQEYFNSVFPSLLDGKEEQAQFKRLPLPPEKQDEFTGVYTYSSVGNKYAAENPTGVDYVKVANIIKTLVNNDKYKIYKTVEDGDEKKLELRPLDYGDIMVLTRGKKALADYSSHFEQEDIPVKVEGSVLFEDNKALKFIYDVYCAVINRSYSNNRVLVEVLTSEYFGHTDNEIANFLKNASKDNPTKRERLSLSLEIKGNSSLEKDIKYLIDFSNRCYESTPSSLFTEIFEQFNIYQKISVDSLEIVYYAQELIRNAEKAGLIVTLEDGASYLNDLISGNTSIERCLSLTKNENRVKLANVHKVKGLEAPIVILAASAMPTKASSRISYKTDPPKGYVFSLEDDNYIPYIKTDKYKGVSRNKNHGDPSLEREYETELVAVASEEKRILYVAATRARNALFISNCENYYYWNNLVPRNCSSFSDEPSSKQNQQANPDTPNSIEAKECYKKAKLNVIEKNRCKQEESFEVHLPSKEEERTASKLSGSDTVSATSGTNPNPSASDDNETEEEKVKAIDKYGVPANIFGTMAHRLMEIMVTRRNYDFDADAVIVSVIEEFLPEEYEKGSAKCKNMLSIIAKKMQNGGIKQKNKAPQDLLAEVRDADEVHCEMNFSHPLIVDGVTQIWRGVMDLVYRKGNKWYIIDYKTALVEMADFDEHYKHQLDAYKKAFKAITNGNEVESAMTYYLNLD